MKLNRKRVKAQLESIKDSLGRYRVDRIKRNFPDLVQHFVALARLSGSTWEKELYLYLHPSESDICRVCGTGTKKFTTLANGFADTCSKLCSRQRPESREQFRLSSLKKHGVAHPSQSQKVKRKLKKTLRRRYGVDHQMKIPKVAKKVAKRLREGASTFKTEEFQAIRKQTLLKKYGSAAPCGNAEIAERRRQTCLAKTGRANGMTDLSVQRARRTREKTLLRTIGVRHQMHNREIADKCAKSCYSIKVEKIEGKTFRVRGSEPDAIRDLISRGVSVTDIRFSAKEGVPTIPYRLNSVHRIYHPDLLVNLRGKETIVEVKSTYTCGLWSDRHRFAVFKKKMKACLAAGFQTALSLVLSPQTVVLVKSPEQYSKRQLEKLLILKGYVYED